MGLFRSTAPRLPETICTRRDFLGSLLVLALATSASAENKPSSDFEKIKAQVEDGSKRLTLTVRLHIKDGTAAQFVAAFAPAIKATRKETGCLRYELNRDAENPNIYLLYERWKSLADLEAHMKAEHYARLLRAVRDLFAAAPEIRVLLPAAE
jgi:quinol monooxygenase YgiN